MLIDRSTAPKRYAVAVGVTLGAIGVQLLLRSWIEATPFIFSFGAVMLSAWYGGRGPGVLAAIVSAVLDAALFLTAQSLLDRGVSVLFFLIVSGLIVTLSGQLHDALAREAHERQEAQEATRLRDTFLSVASHELKTPLTALLLQVGGVLRRVPADQVDGIGARLKIIERQVIRLDRLVSDMLEVTRLQRGALSLRGEELDLDAVAREVAGRFVEVFQREGATLEIRSPGSLLGRWDRLRIEQVLTNLLSNAAKYGAGKPVALILEGTPNTVRCTVRDHGIGIAIEDQARIFEQFERAVSERHFGGLGLGLWITRELVTAMGGSIQVVSTPGDGSAFTFELPREDPSLRRPAAHHDQTATKGSGPAEG